MKRQVKAVLLFIKDYKRFLLLLLTPILLSPLLPSYEALNLTQKACNCLYMLLLMAVYWCTEALPLPVTALFPLFLAPMLGILEASVVCLNYFKDKITLFIGSLIIATGIQHSGLHKRIALTFLRLFGTNPRFLMLGFMLPTWFLSMWISNTATTAMMVAILSSVLHQLKKQSDDWADLPEEHNLDDNEDSSSIEMEEKETMMGANCNADDLETQDCEVRTPASSHKERHSKHLAEAKCLSLAVCYAATCGGVATLTGTGTNLVLYDNIVFFGKKTGNDFDVNFANWMLFALPLSLILLLICWAWLQVFFLGIRKQLTQTEQEKQIITSIIRRELQSLGGMTWREGITLVHFVMLAVLWLSRNPGKAGGWGQLFPSGYVSDGTAVMLVAVSLMAMPDTPPRLLTVCKKFDAESFHPLLPWKIVSEQLNWGVCFIIAGGFALADCVDKSGLSEAIGTALLGLVQGIPVWVMVLLLCVTGAAVTEFTSNVVICSLLLPIIGDLALAMELNPLLLMIPVGVATSFAFMLPAATPPNAIVFSSGYLTIKDMMLVGFVLNLIAVCLVTLAGLTWAPPIFKYHEYSFAQSNITSAAANMTFN